MTYTLMGISIVVFIAQFLTGGVGGKLTEQLAYTTGDIFFLPWTFITASFAHANILHILFNMYSLFVLGPTLEMLLGRVRFLLLFLISGIGGWVALDLIDPGSALGASAGIFGLLGALFVIQRRSGGNLGQLASVIVLNLVIGFFVPQVAWQAHVGGLIAGAVIGLLYLETRARKRRPWQIVGLIVLVVALLVTSAVKTLLLAG